MGYGSQKKKKKRFLLSGIHYLQHLFEGLNGFFGGERGTYQPIKVEFYLFSLFFSFLFPVFFFPWEKRFHVTSSQWGDIRGQFGTRAFFLSFFVL